MAYRGTLGRRVAVCAAQDTIYANTEGRVTCARSSVHLGRLKIHGAVITLDLAHRAGSSNNPKFISTNYENLYLFFAPRKTPVAGASEGLRAAGVEK
jgi:hypothetical protein